MNCTLETRRTLTTESLTVFLRQETWPLSTRSGVCKHNLPVYTPSPSPWTLFKWEGRKCKREILFLLARLTENFTCRSCTFCPKEQASPLLCWLSQRVQRTASPPSTSFVQQPRPEHQLRDSRYTTCQGHSSEQKVSALPSAHRGHGPLLFGFCLS